MNTPIPLISTALSCVLLALSACTVTETGYLQRDRISVTAEQPIEDRDVAVLVTGSEGAVEQTGGTLTATVVGTERTQTVTVDDPSGSFVVAIDARSTDSVSLTYDLDGEDTAVIALDGSATLEAPDCADCIGFFTVFSAPDENGDSTAVLDPVFDPTPPFVLINQTRGIAVRADAIDPAPRLPASAGDTACVYQLAGAQTSRAKCEVIPSA